VPYAQVIEERKASPFCGEAVLAIAKKCRHCDETIDVALRAAEEAKRAAERTETPTGHASVLNAGGAASSSSSSAAAAASGKNLPNPVQSCFGCLVLMVMGLMVMFCGGCILGLNDFAKPASHKQTSQKQDQPVHH
jgi:hypothetical protein